MPWDWIESNSMATYNFREMMTIAAARCIRDDDIVFCGTGISMLAAMAAKHINAPGSLIFFETGAIDSELQEIPLAVGDSRVMYGTSVNGNLASAFATMQNRITGRKVVGIMGAAQIDRFGNLNSTVIGDYATPKVRFSGSGGACDVASFVRRTIIFMKHKKQKFVPQVDYLTSPGWIDGPNGRKKAGLPEGGPEKVITNMATMGFDESTKEMYLEGCYPGISPQQVLDNMSFNVDISRATEISPPTNEELRILRDVCDPQRLILN
jgi:glutaconate CoA-transferase, subunit B